MAEIQPVTYTIDFDKASQVFTSGVEVDPILAAYEQFASLNEFGQSQNLKKFMVALASDNPDPIVLDSLKVKSMKSLDLMEAGKSTALDPTRVATWKETVASIDLSTPAGRTFMQESVKARCVDMAKEAFDPLRAGNKANILRDKLVVNFNGEKKTFLHADFKIWAKAQGLTGEQVEAISYNCNTDSQVKGVEDQGNNAKNLGTARIGVEPGEFVVNIMTDDVGQIIKVISESTKITSCRDMETNTLVPVAASTITIDFTGLKEEQYIPGLASTPLSPKYAVTELNPGIEFAGFTPEYVDGQIKAKDPVIKAFDVSVPDSIKGAVDVSTEEHLSQIAQISADALSSTYRDNYHDTYQEMYGDTVLDASRDVYNLNNDIQKQAAYISREIPSVLQQKIVESMDVAIDRELQEWIAVYNDVNSIIDEEKPKKIAQIAADKGLGIADALDMMVNSNHVQQAIITGVCNTAAAITDNTETFQEQVTQYALDRKWPPQKCAELILQAQLPVSQIAELVDKVEFNDTQQQEFINTVIKNCEESKKAELITVIASKQEMTPQQLADLAIKAATGKKGVNVAAAEKYGVEIEGVNALIKQIIREKGLEINVRSSIFKMSSPAEKIAFINELSTQSTREQLTQQVMVYTPLEQKAELMKALSADQSLTPQQVVDYVVKAATSSNGVDIAAVEKYGEGVDGARDLVAQTIRQNKMQPDISGMSDFSDLSGTKKAEMIATFTEPGQVQDKFVQIAIDNTSLDTRPELIAQVAKQQNISVQEAIDMTINSCSGHRTLDLDQAAKAIQAIAEHVEHPKIKEQMLKNPKRIIMYAAKESGVELDQKGSLIDRLTNMVRGNPLKGMDIVKQLKPQDVEIAAPTAEQKTPKVQSRRTQLSRFSNRSQDVAKAIHSGLQNTQNNNRATNATRTVGHSKGKEQSGGIGI